MIIGRLIAAAATAALIPTLAACGSSDSSGGSGGSGDDGQVVVLAASSLTGVFGQLKKTYQSQHPGVTVKLSFDSSAILAEQVVQGNPADVLATADEATMKRVSDAGLTASSPKPFASNSLTLVVPPANPAKITGIKDLNRADVKYAVCVPEAPCGDASKRLLKLDGITAKATTQEQNVKAVLTKVTLGEVDAGLVYASDAQSAGDKVHAISIKNASEVVNADPIAVLEDAKNAKAAMGWVDLVLGPTGQQALKSYGFGSAPKE